MDDKKPVHENDEEPLEQYEYVRERVVVRFDTTLWKITLQKNAYGEVMTWRTPLTPSCWDGSDIPF